MEIKDVFATITGKGIFGIEWIDKIKAAGFYFSREVKDSLYSKGYEKFNKLIPKKKYKAYFLLGDEILEDGDRTTKNLFILAKRKFGKDFEKGEGMRAEAILASRLKISNKDNLYFYYKDMNSFWLKKGLFIFLY